MNSYYKALCCRLPTTKLNSVVLFQEVGDLTLFMLSSFPKLLESCLEAYKERSIIFEQKYSYNSKVLDVFVARELNRGVKMSNTFCV